MNGTGVRVTTGTRRAVGQGTAVYRVVAVGLVEMFSTGVLIGIGGGVSIVTAIFVGAVVVHSTWMTITADPKIRQILWLGNMLMTRLWIPVTPSLDHVS